MNHGKLIGIGVGPGNPEYLTLKAIKILKKVPVICAPRSAESRPSVALSIVTSVLNERDLEYELLDPVFPMIEDEAALHVYWDEAARQVKERLEKGSDVAFITLGDPTVYSTFSYLEKKIGAENFEVEIVPGVTSFTGCAASAHLSLGEKDEIIVIVPKVDERLSQILEHADTAVIMKTSRHSKKLEDIIKADNRDKDIISVQNCGMEDEKIVEGFAQDKKYLSTTIVKFK
ncbi:MAG TPA: precorrin-2 C(20)-methyltransferase [Methanobacteriaceae archaeon]|nr:precorrin-2 C(20)-methyltransferase [Methanobacteriaceae archaeon]